MKHKKLKKPWLNQNGKSHSIEALRDISKTWDPGTWEDYLSTLEQQGSESFVSPGELERQIEKQSLETYFEKDTTDNSVAKREGSLREKIRDSLAVLTPIQKRILRCLYWKNMRVCDIAELLGIEESLVIYHRDYAERAIRTSFIHTGFGAEVHHG